MTATTPSYFSVVFETNYGLFSADCVRDRAPIWVDRIYNAARNGYYSDNYFYRVINKTSSTTNRTLGIVQFGINGDPAVSAYYRASDPKCVASVCGILQPQPPYMPYQKNLSNVFGTISMTASSNKTTGTTWNVTAGLFINTWNNSQLDAQLFIPVCTISKEGMAVVMSFPSVGEMQELDGPGISQNRLYAEGNNKYIESNASYAKMGKVTAAYVKTTSLPPSGALTNADQLHLWRMTAGWTGLVLFLMV